MEKYRKVKIEYNEMLQHKTHTQNNNQSRLDYAGICDDRCRSKEFIHDRNIVSDDDYYGVHLSDLAFSIPLCPNSKYQDYVEWTISKHNKKHPLVHPLYQGISTKDDYYFPRLFSVSSYAIALIKHDFTRSKGRIWKLSFRYLLYAYFVYCVLSVLYRFIS